VTTKLSHCRPTATVAGTKPMNNSDSATDDDGASLHASGEFYARTINEAEKQQHANMKVKHSYLSQQFADPEPILDQIRELTKRGDYTLGEAVDRFERAFADYVGTKYAVGVNSGTDALALTLRALDIGQGYEVITTPFTFIATVSAIVQAGAKPVFVDCKDDLTIDAERIPGAFHPGVTRAIIPVHYTGKMCDVYRIREFARLHDISVVEDACQAIGSSLDGRKAGAWGDAGAFSLHPLKNLNVWGDGGMVATDDEFVRDQLRRLRNHGKMDRDSVANWGFNSRLDTLQALVGLGQVATINHVTYARAVNAAFYNERFSDIPQVRTPVVGVGECHCFHLYMLIVEDRDRLLTHLRDSGVDAKVHYPIPVHLQVACRDLHHARGDFPVAERLADSVITLPVHQHLTSAELGYVADSVRKFYKK